MDLELGSANVDFRRDVRVFLDDKHSEDLKEAVTASTGTFCDLPGGYHLARQTYTYLAVSVQ